MTFPTLTDVGSEYLSDLRDMSVKVAEIFGLPLTRSYLFPYHYNFLKQCYHYFYFCYA